ncbi:uncharacterized protein LOC110228545 [Arabidopsis lyrata subsp. lyrata]|uniref:uncharacterized protein LOC110228545 n=1 Tax=Arabidopsis lyrata subsp. lyrata TaxID=81972 RepID=UPI000A29AE46|nr:uncharacterized protein LOC110228545 [Arabidopsis lyrata subsp. lyrata]|eukprot:XP_020881874.1 uncharacterized protein LOC110228545 [Arabidopsis lyrata subsp. lyrata]
MTWRLSGTPAFQSHQPFNDVEENISKLLDVYDSPHISKALKLSQFWILWRIWKARNNFVFNQYRESPSKVVLKAKAETNEWITNTAPRLNSSISQSSNSEQPKWYTPEQPFVKCNFDASYSQITMQARGGWIIRDHHGTAKAWGSLHLNGAASPLMAEAKALLAAMHQAWLRGFTHVILEGDCELIV